MPKKEWVSIVVGSQKHKYFEKRKEFGKITIVRGDNCAIANIYVAYKCKEAANITSMCSVYSPSPK